MTRAQPPEVGWRLGTRLFVTSATAQIASVLTAGLVAAIVGPPLFHSHLVEAGHQEGGPEIGHIERAFSDAGLVSLSVGLLVALVLALAVSWYVTRRIRVPLDGLTRAARRMSTGDYRTRVSVTGAGPELATLADSFNTMAERLGSVEETRRRLLSDLAHELRTPVATLNAHLEALTDGITEWNDATREVLEFQSARLTRLARDLDDVSRAEEGRVTLDLADEPLRPLVTGVVDQLRASYADKGVDLELEVADAAVRVDRQRIAQVLGNVLVNALRHTPAGGSVAIEAVTDHGEVVITVTDTGEGLTDEQLSHIFERFYRGDSARERDKAGSGIGLTIAKAFAEAHGGSLTATSDGPGLGARFSLRLPRFGPTVSD